MPTNEQVIEIVRFTQTGVDAVTAGVKVLGDQIKATGDKQKTLSELMGSSRFRLREQQLDAMNKKYELMSLRMRGVAAAAALADGSAVKHLRSVAALNRGLADTQRRTEMAAKYGERWGAIMHRYGGALSGLGTLAGGAAGMGLNLARQGFQGTTEGARQDYERTLLSREFASVMKPVHDLMTRAMRGARERMERLSGGGQNALLGGMLVGGTAAGAMALRASSQLIGAVAGETMASKFRGGLGRFALGGLGAGALGYGIATNNVSSGVAGGAMLGFSMGGLPGAVVGAVGGGLAARASGLPDARLGENPSEYYRRMRGMGKTRFGAGVDTALEAPSEMWRQMTMTDAARRNVQISGGGFDEPGTAAERINVAIEKVKTEAETPKAPAAPDTADKMLKALEDIRDAFTTGDGWKRDRIRGNSPWGG